jgi:PKD repeat protein
MLKSYATITLTLLISLGFSQGKTKRVLFLGNSYTYVNDLPKTIADMALSTDDTLIYDSNCPGGYTFQGHATNATSFSKIKQGNWDYVVLQEQSQYPSFPINQVEADVFPYAKMLDSLIHVSSPCAQTVFYMTWGRKNGDASNCPSWPPVCTYNGMDSLLRLRYETMATSNKSLLSPVSVVWKYLRNNNPLIELYQSDESHPSEAGTYAAACSFYTVFFQKDPTNVTFKSTLLLADLVSIRNAAKTTVFDHPLQWHIGEYYPQATFTNTTITNQQVQFTNTSINATAYQWLFGDGDSSSTPNPTHQYSSAGTYNVKLIASNCSISDTLSKSITIGTTAILTEDENSAISISPNPVHAALVLSKGFAIEATYTVFDISGRVVQKGTLFSNENRINVENLKSGNYFIAIQKSKGATIRLPFYRSND